MSAAILAQVAPLVQSPRKGMIELLDLVEQINDLEICELIGAATQMMVHRPRYSTRISVDTKKKRETVIKLMGLVERVEDSAILELCREAKKLVIDSPRYPVTNADIVRLPRRPATKGREAGSAP